MTTRNMAPATHPADGLAPVKHEIVPDSHRLYVIFGGIKGGLGVPAFEFYESSKLLVSSRIFVRDHAQAWYSKGLPGVARNAFELGEWLEREIERSGSEEVRFVGNSMGGFAAILFSAMLGRGRAIAFSPQTCIEPDRRAIWGDSRWAEQVEGVLAVADPKVLDLKNYLNSVSTSRLDVDVHVSSAEPLDLEHASYISDIRGVAVSIHPQGGHAVVRHLRDSGQLAEILRR